MSAIMRELDQPEAVAAAQKWLQKLWRDSGGIGPDQNADFVDRVISRVLWEGGLSEATAAKMLREEFGPRVAELTPEALATKVHVTYVSAAEAKHSVKQAKARAKRSDGAEAANDNADADARARQLMASMFSIGEAAERRASALNRKPLIKGVLNCGTFAALTAPHKSGKTFIALDIAAHIATGRPWNGRAVAQGVAIHFLCEGQGGAYDRVEALKLAKGIPANAPMYVLPMPVDLFNSAKDARAIIDVAKTLAAKHGFPVQLITIDTKARAMPGGNENLSEDDGKFIANIDLIRSSTGAAVLVLHHTGWDDKTRSRGSTALPAAVDAELLLKDKKEIVFQNLRDFEEPDPIPYQLVSAPAGRQDDEGNEVYAAVVKYTKASDEFENLAGLEAGQRKVILAKLADETWRESEKSEKFAGYALAEILAVDIGSIKKDERTEGQNAARARVKDILDQLVKDEIIAVEDRPDDNRNPRRTYVVKTANND